jgi:uncharacterized membrane protein YkvA (DUF1232 family)
MLTPNDVNSSSVASAAGAPVGERAVAVEPAPLRHWLGRAIKGASEAVGQRYLQRLGGGPGALRESLSGIPDRFQRAAQQSRLVLELLDDVRAGTYRDLSWYSVPVAAAAVLYTISPADVVPDALPFLGGIDDVALLALAVRLLRNDLRAYCRFKGYPEGQYFDLPS